MISSIEETECVEEVRVDIRISEQQETYDWINAISPGR